MVNPAFPGPYAPGSPEMSKYDQYAADQNGVLGGQNNAPAPQGPASQGALQGEAGAPAEPAFKGSKEEGATGSDFFSMWRDADDDDREVMTKNVMEPIEAKGVSIEGAAKQMFDTNPQLAAEIGAKFGIVPPADKAGMPGFKTQEQALIDYEKDKTKAADEKSRLKLERRHALGGFLFEMGLRILASNRPDAGGAIAEGALGTFDERRKRKTEAEDRKIGKTELERKRKREDAADVRAESAEGRAASKEARDQEVHDIKKEAGTLGQSAYENNNFERQWSFFNKYHEEDIPNEAERGRAYMDWYKNVSRMKQTDKNKEVQTWIDRINDGDSAPPKEYADKWHDMTGSEQKAAIIEMFPELGGEPNKSDAGDDPLGLK